MVNLVGKQFGNYRLTRFLDDGAFAEVYLGEHQTLRTQVAVKVQKVSLAKNQINQFRTEATTVANLTHPHIVRVFDFGVEGNTPFMVMDYAPNGTLRQRYPTGTSVPLQSVVSYVKQVAEALQYAHNEKLIHRDIKPENMLLGSQDQIWLSDFGIAVIAHSTHSMIFQDKVGTLEYMAPEQFQGKPVIASDQYALGIVAYEWLCGETPFHGTVLELFAQHLSVVPPSLCAKAPTVSPAVEQVVFQALEKDPKQRFPSVQEFADALEKASNPPLPQAAVLPQNVIAPTQLVSPPIPLPPTLPPSPLAPTIPAKLPNHGKLLLTCHTQLGNVAAIAWSHNGQYLASRNNDSIEIWDTTNGSNIFSHTNKHNHYPQNQSPTQPTTSQKSKGFFSRWLSQPQPTSMPPVTYHRKRKDSLLAQWSPSQQIIVIGNSDGIIQLWDADLKSQLWIANLKDPLFNSYSDSTLEIQWLANGKYIASAVHEGDRNNFDVWEVANGQRIFDKYFTDGSRPLMRCAPNLDQIAFASRRSGMVQIWDIVTKGLNFSYSQNDIRDLAWTDNGEHLICVTGSAALIWNVHTGFHETVHSLTNYSSYDYRFFTLSQVTISPSNTQVAFIRDHYGGSNVRIIKNTLEIRDIMKPHNGNSIPLGYNSSYSALQWSSDMRNIFLLSFRLEVWNISSSKQVASYDFSTFALSPDDARIATASNDKTLQLWEVTTHNHLFTYPGYASRIKLIAWSPDGKRLAIVLDDSTIQILQAQ